MEAQLFVFAAVAISEVFSACSPTGTKFKNFPRTPKRSIRFRIGVTSKKCPGLDEFYYHWSVQEVPGYLVLKTSSTPYLSIDGYTFSAKNCYSVGYLVTVKVSHYPDMSYADEAKDTFYFMADPLHIEILGGSEKCHPYGEDLVMDAKTLSKDLSFLSDENPFEGNYILWSVPESFKNFDPPNQLQFTVPHRYLHKESAYTFIITVTRTKIPQYKSISTASQLVRIMTEEFPQLNILCVRNCIFFNPLDVTVFIVQCYKNCKFSYKWIVEPPVQSHAKLDFGDGYDKLVIPNDAFRQGENIKVILKSGPSDYAIQFTFSTGVVIGKCEINPKEGISSVTQFRVNCSGFQSPNGIVIYNIYQKKGKEHILVSEETYYRDSDVYLAPGLGALIVVEAVDNAYLHEFLYLTVDVHDFQHQENVEMTSAVKQLVLSTDNTSITSYSIEGYNNEAVQLLSGLVETIKYIKMDAATTRDLHKHMAEALLRIHPEKYGVAFQVLLALLKLERFRIEEDTVTAEVMARAMAHAVSHLHEMHNHEHDRYIPQTFIEDFAKMTLSLCSEILRYSEKILNMLNVYTPVHEYDSYDDFVSFKVRMRHDFNNIVKLVMVTIQTISVTALYKTIPNERPKFYRSSVIGVKVQRKIILGQRSLALLVLKGVGADNAIILPQEFMRKLERINYYVDFQTGVFWTNPFWWHVNGTKLNTRIVLFDIFLHCNQIDPFGIPFRLKFEVLEVPSILRFGSITDDSIASYRIELEGYRTLVARFETVPMEYESYQVTWADCECTEKDFKSKRSKVISTNTLPLFRSIIIPHDEGFTKVLFICIRKLATEVVSYEMTLTSYSCVHYDLKSLKWSGEGCRVIRFGFDYYDPLICECHHFSLFAGLVSVPRNTLMAHKDIDFTIAFVKNYIMISVVGVIILLWIFSLILAHLRDKALKKKNVVYKLDDNVPGDRFGYLVVVFTGMYYDAPTTADVGFRLIGVNARSRAHLIKYKDLKLLQRNGQAWFTIYCPYYLGEIKKIRLWHNTKGKLPHWYCERVIVQDLQTANQYCFRVEKWFSLIWGKGKIYREIRMKRSMKKERKMLFLAHLQHDMRDKHVWLSITVRDFQSNFNSKERLSAGFCFLFASLSANVLYSGVPSGAPMDSIDESGKFFLSAKDIIVFIESWLTASVITLFIIFLFKNSGP